MGHEIAGVSGLPFTLYAKANYPLLIQFLFGFLALILAFWFHSEGHMIFYALLEILAALGLLIFAANFANFLIRWRSLQKGCFTATGKIIDVTRDIKNPSSRIYKVEFSDAESCRREAMLKSEPWEKLAYEPGDEITILYDPLNPRELINYSAYESLK